MNGTTATLTTIAVLALACSQPPAAEEPEAAVEYAVEAERVAQEAIVVDTHIDLPYRLQELEEPVDVTQRSEEGDFDYPRAREGGLDVAFMSIYVPAGLQQDPVPEGGGPAAELANELIDGVEAMAAEHPEAFTVVDSVEAIRAGVGQDRVLLAMGMENGAPIDSIETLEYFYDRGIRYITLAHSENNQLSDSSFADDRKWNGLSDFGREVVTAMNDLGIMVDVSHLSDDAIRDVFETTTAPVIASHSSCRHFTPGYERNMSDELIQALAANGGVIQINFGSSFIKAETNEQGTAFWEARAAYAEENGLERGDPKLEEFQEQYFADNPFKFADVTDVADHIDHVVGLVGVDHVGLGSDYDGVGDTLPTGLKDVSQYPNLFEVLLERGYSEEDIGKIAGENLLRVWSEVERVAAEIGAEEAA